MSQFILHHYPPSPVSEKIRTAFGLKQIEWVSVEQNRLPDRPELLAMTGGFRRIPVLQIGADIYCDTQCIFRELERRSPDRSFFPTGDKGTAYAMSRWTDDELFGLVMRVAFAPAVATLPQALVADRTRLYLGPNGDLHKEAKDLPHTLAQLRTHLGWLEDSLADDQAWLTGAQAGLTDLVVWTDIWFLQGRYAKAEEFMAEFPKLNAWAERMRAIGHGTASGATPAEALEIAAKAQPQTAEAADANDPQGLVPGMTVGVVPLSDSGESPVIGEIVAVGREDIAIRRSHELCGEVVVHFPRVGYRVVPQ